MTSERYEPFSPFFREVEKFLSIFCNFELTLNFKKEFSQFSEFCTYSISIYRTLVDSVYSREPRRFSLQMQTTANPTELRGFLERQKTDETRPWLEFLRRNLSVVNWTAANYKHRQIGERSERCVGTMRRVGRTKDGKRRERRYKRLVVSWCSHHPLSG